MKVAVPQVVSAGFGLAMVVVPATGSHGPAVVVAAIAVVVVIAGVLFRSATTQAVLLAVAVIALVSPPPMLVALSGLCAAAYLVLRHTAVTGPTMVAAVGFTLVGLIAAWFPLRVAWLPLIAPLAAFGSYALATHPFLGTRR